MTPPIFFFNAPAPTRIYTLSLHDALPISPDESSVMTTRTIFYTRHLRRGRKRSCLDRKSTRLNSSHVSISYAVFCLKKKIKRNERQDRINHQSIQNQLSKQTSVLASYHIL